MSRVALPREETRCCFQDIDGLLELTIPFLQRLDLGGCFGADPVALAVIDLPLTDQFRSVSAVIPNRDDTAVIAFHSLGYSPR